MSKSSQKESFWAEIIANYSLHQSAFKTLSKEFDRKKSEFYEQMDQMFSETEAQVDCNTRKLKYTKKPGESYVLSVSKVQPVKVVFDAEKLEAKIPKSISKKVISKSYVINDFSSLVQYLKSCNVDPKKFKSFLDVQRTVDENALDQAVALGEVEEEQVKECCSVSKNTPYYKVSIKRKEDEEVK